MFAQQRGVGVFLNGTQSVLDAWWQLAGILSGGMLGLFILGLITRDVRGRHALAGVCVGVMFIIWMTLSPIFFADSWFAFPWHANLFQDRGHWFDRSNFRCNAMGVTARFIRFLLLGLLCVGIIGPITGSTQDRVAYNYPELIVDLGVGLWAWPMPVDYDSDGDWDLLVSCPDVPSISKLISSISSVAFSSALNSWYILSFLG